jgi:hypothetical protein
VLAAGNLVNNVGAGVLNPGAGHFYQIWTTTPATDTYNGLTPAFIQYNATYGSTTPAQSTGNGFLYTLAPITSVVLQNTTSKVYDGTTTAALTGSNYAITGVVNGDVVTFNEPASGNYNNANVGNGKNVSATGINILTATNGSATVYGYQLSSTTASGNIGSITPLAITSTGITANNKTFNGNTSASLNFSGATLNGVLGGDSVSINANNYNANFDSSSVGTHPVNVSFIGLTNSNYTLAAPTGLFATILSAPTIPTSTVPSAGTVFVGLDSSSNSNDSNVDNVVLGYTPASKAVMDNIAEIWIESQLPISAVRPILCSGNTGY